MSSANCNDKDANNVGALNKASIITFFKKLFLKNDLPLVIKKYVTMSLTL